MKKNPLAGHLDRYRALDFREYLSWKCFSCKKGNIYTRSQHPGQIFWDAAVLLIKNNQWPKPPAFQLIVWDADASIAKKISDHKHTACQFLAQKICGLETYVKITDTASDKKCKKYDKHILHILAWHDVLDFTRISGLEMISYVKKIYTRSQNPGQTRWCFQKTIWDLNAFSAKINQRGKPFKCQIFFSRWQNEGDNWHRGRPKDAV